MEWGEHTGCIIVISEEFFFLFLFVKSASCRSFYTHPIGIHFNGFSILSP